MCKIDNQQNIEKLKTELGIGWYIYPIELNTLNSSKAEPSLKNKKQLFCVHCLSKNISLIGYDNYNTVNGQSAEWVYSCSNCGKRMTLVNEFNQK